MANHPEDYAHYFVATNIVIANRQFFLEHRKKTIVLSMSLDGTGQLSEFNSICINVPEKMLVRSLLMLEQHAHAHGRNLPPQTFKGISNSSSSSPLSTREIEVLSLIVQGYLNKEIADQLNIGLTTVITHRKNLMDKLGLRSVGALTIYAVMHGYVDINSI
jgi:ATP/maltotriose-dependent transcriptional regulator MalT